MRSASGNVRSPFVTTYDCLTFLTDYGVEDGFVAACHGAVSYTHLDVYKRQGILGADQAGFLSQRWADSFLDCCAEVLGAAVDRAAQQVSYRGHVTGVAVRPLGVDADELVARAAEPDVQDRLAALTAAAGGTRVIVRVDRTELSKNIARGLAAYRELLFTDVYKRQRAGCRPAR